MRSYLLASLCLFGVLSPASAGWLWDSREEILAEHEANRRKVLVELRSTVSGTLALPILAFAAITLMGPTLIERFRPAIVRRFNLGPDELRLVASKVYGACIALVLILLLFDSAFRSAVIPILILLAATTYPFMVLLLPNLDGENASERKAGLAQLKSLFMMILVIYMLMWMLSPDGMGPIKLDPR